MQQPATLLINGVLVPLELFFAVCCGGVGGGGVMTSALFNENLSFHHVYVDKSHTPQTHQVSIFSYSALLPAQVHVPHFYLPPTLVHSNSYSFSTGKRVEKLITLESNIPLFNDLWSRMDMVTGKRVCCTYVFGKTMVTTRENRYDKYCSLVTASLSRIR